MRTNKMRGFLNAVMHAARQGASAVRQAVLDVPLHQLYFHGPLLYGYGFWGGASKEDMCTALAPGTTAFFWSQNQHQCDDVLNLRFNAFRIAVQFGLYLFVMYRLAQWCCFQLFVLRPMLKRVDGMIKAQQEGWTLEGRPGAAAPTTSTFMPSLRKRRHYDHFDSDE